VKRFVPRRTKTERVDVAALVASATLRIPDPALGPARAIARRILMAVAALFLAAGVVYLGRSGYRHVNGTELTFVDAFYYATVSLSTTGYGDISPITPRARLTNIVVITPLRVVFLVLLVGTTLSALTETSRQIARIKRWRRRASGHTVVVGYGTKGRAAVDAVLAADRKAKVAVVDSHPPALEAASARELTTIAGSGSQRGVLAAAAVDRAESIIVAVDRDDACVLVTLTARQLAPSARIVAAVRSSSSVKILKQCGADTVVVSQETARAAARGGDEFTDCRRGLRAPAFSRTRRLHHRTSNRCARARPVADRLRKTRARRGARGSASPPRALYRRPTRTGRPSAVPTFRPGITTVAISARRTNR
jgi:voltage-gated potassium channel